MSSRPPQLQRLHDFLVGKGDVPIRDIYRCVYRRPPPKSNIKAQQALGDYIARYNKLGGGRIVPGTIKQTYVLKDTNA